jgi:hypothetical protein
LFSTSVALAAGPFTDNGDGTITDSSTGLIWLKNANCNDTAGGITKYGPLTWYDAATWSSGLASGACGLTDGSQAGEWGIPTKEEIESLFRGEGAPQMICSGDFCSIYNPDGAYPYLWLTNQGFTSVHSGKLYWTSSTKPDYPNSAWVVYMYNGYIGYISKLDYYYAWPVRGDYYVRVDGSPNVYYPSLQNAFDSVADDSVIRARGLTFTETLSLNRPVTVRLLGGYNIDYTTQTGVTTINGTLTIAKGSLEVDRVVIR